MWRDAGAEPRAFRRASRGRSCPAAARPAAGEALPLSRSGRDAGAIAATKGESFYRGALAERIVGGGAAEGGAMTLDDLAEHRADWVEPLGVDFKGYRIHELPPNGQGSPR